MEQNYYVYLYQDPRDMQPFYVGKGKGKRSAFHMKEAEDYRAGKQSPRKINLPKIKRIISILDAGRKPVISKVFEGTHEECLIEERRLVIALGRVPNGPLLNQTDGGDGTEGFRHSEETRALFSRQRKGKGHPHTEGHKQKLRDDNRGGAATRKQVIKFTPEGIRVATYNSLTALSKELDLTKANCLAYTVKDGSLPREGFFYRYHDSPDITSEGIKNAEMLIAKRDRHDRGVVAGKSVVRTAADGISEVFESVRAAEAGTPGTKYATLWASIKYNRVYEGFRWAYGDQTISDCRI